MLELWNLTAGYPGKDVLQDISFTAQAGEVTAILGPNGCGKTTLLKALCGILPVNRGKILLDGKPLPEYAHLAQQVAYLPQNRQVPQITAGRLVLHGRFPYLSYPRRYRPEDMAAARAAMEAMDIADLTDTPMEQLSGGQRQKVYIAMALAQDTPVILLDEPTAFLDIRHQLQLLQQAKDLAARGKTVLMVVHDLSHAQTWADKIVLLREGRVEAQGTPEAVFNSGALDRVFGVEVCRVLTDSGWQYFSRTR